jgi:thiol-disulfide isomerase/thioredoxin
MATDAAVVLALLFAVRVLTMRGLASGAAPPLAARDLSGRAVSLDDYGGRPVLVHFWATWCGVCKAENATIDTLARDHTVVTVATDSGEAEAIRASMDRSGLTFPVVVDADGDVARAWGVSRFPTSFFLDRAHRIRTAETGLTTSPGYRLRMWLAGE